MRVALVATALVLAGCAGGATEPTTDTAPVVSSTTTPPVTSIMEQDTGTTATTGPTDSPPATGLAPNPDRPLAPDFSLTLSDGTLYEYSSEVRPVFMVFWAEW